MGKPSISLGSDTRKRRKSSFRRLGRLPFPLPNRIFPTALTNKLKGITYFQGRWSVNNYLDDFRDLITESGYTDPKTIVVKFWRGLNPATADAIATMATRRPDDLDLEAWYQAAIQFDQNQAANAAFRSAHFANPQQKTTPTASAVRTHPVAHPNRSNFPPWFVVFGSPVLSGFLTPRVIDCNCNRSFYFGIPEKTRPNRCGPVHIGFLRL